jgi:carbon dioxide concentrating mechanism protein CcmN
MHLPPLPLSSNNYVHTEGEVSIDPSAAIGSGVILRAATDSKIIIGAGVCIGIGSILTASQGILEVEAGANLGAGVLMVGKGKIGTNACIGALTTIWNASIEPWQVVPPGSLVGDKGRQVPTPASVTESVIETTPPLPASTGTTGQESWNGQAVPAPTTVVSHTAPADSTTELQAEAPTTEPEKSVYGQENLNRLLKTLFPYNNQSFNPPPEDS